MKQANRPIFKSSIGSLVRLSCEARHPQPYGGWATRPVISRHRLALSACPLPHLREGLYAHLPASPLLRFRLCIASVLDRGVVSC
ncbi:hypothetical protein FNU76_18725 [Chitinimonas arctica]|uniref:Uncharacterized protein n=1 Tax=Chitinimonas arctica TaxID=2594795 RepID=A0A516SJ97_9NEIS|nr:hypothetical protein [Chitinimonas arctica]QDQ28217.1 hypothetical protein FNU76_18725 [Chitinimonas arctica]